MVSTGFTAGMRGRTVSTVILAAALAVGAAACGSSGGSGSSPAASATSGTAAASPSASPVSTATVTGAAATALIIKAIADTKAATTLLVVGSGISSGSGTSGDQVSFNLTMVQKAGCRGAIALSKVESFQLIETGGDVWLKPTNAFYTTLHLSQAALALVADKYIRVPADNAQVADLAKICSISGLFGELPTPTGTAYVATPTTYNGKNAYKITQTGQAGYAYITNSSSPVLLKLAEPTANGGVIGFTEYSAPLAITAPPAAESIDGTKLGI